MLRTCMFIPGDKDKHLEKLKTFSADAYILDLEDAVAEKNKSTARQKVKRIIEETENPSIFVRVNDVGTDYFLDDIQEVIHPNLAGIVLPMANKKEDIVIADYLLGKIENKHLMQNGSVSIIPIIETTSGLYHAYDIASVSKRVSCLAFGAEDFMLHTNMETDEEQTQLLYARSKLVTESNAAGINPPVDSVYTDFRDNEGLKNAAMAGRKLGFQGKLVIHPNQIQVVNEVFSPSVEQITEAEEIVEAYNKALLSGSGAVQVNGKMVDAPVAERAKMILETKDRYKTKIYKEGE